MFQGVGANNLTISNTTSKPVQCSYKAVDLISQEKLIITGGMVPCFIFIFRFVLLLTHVFFLLLFSELLFFSIFTFILRRLITVCSTRALMDKHYHRIFVDDKNGITCYRHS